MIQFEVAGEPGPKGSRTIGRRKNGSTYSRPASKRQKPWEEAVVKATEEVFAARGMDAPIAPPYSICLRFLRVRPKRPAHPWPSGDDLDKLVRCTIDGLVKGGLLDDDRHVVSLHAEERYAAPGDGAGCAVQAASVRMSC